MNQYQFRVCKSSLRELIFAIGRTSEAFTSCGELGIASHLKETKYIMTRLKDQFEMNTTVTEPNNSFDIMVQILTTRYGN
jgi:hypothetical protein